jgi:hypothetical protein
MAKKIKQNQNKSNAGQFEQKNKKTKADWATILGILGVVIAAISAIIAIRSNKIAEESNKITEQSLAANLITSQAFNDSDFAFEYFNLLDDSNDVICRMESDNSLIWDAHYLIGIDANNPGANPFSIRGITVEDKLITNYMDIPNFFSFEASGIRFTNYEEYKTWVENSSYPSDTLKERGNIAWENTPFSIENGSIKRLLVGVRLNVWWNKTLERDVLQEKIPEPIAIPINFYLGDNTVRKFTFEIDDFFMMFMISSKISP